jgi:N-acetylmuramoyl-L-alanine amidase
MPAGAQGKPSTGGPTLAPTAGGPLSGKTIVVDPGHNGALYPSINNRRVMTPIGSMLCMASGTESDSTPVQTEHAVNWAVAQDVSTLLRSKGATVVLTRPDDAGVGPCNNVRAEIANNAKADFLIAIHADGQRPTSFQANPQGFHVQLEKKQAEIGGAELYNRSLAAAENVVREMQALTSQPLTNYVPRTPAGIWQRTGDLAVLGGLKVCPGVLIEMGNMKNAADLARIEDPAMQQSIATALEAAIEDTLLKPQYMTPSPGPATASPSAKASASASVVKKH